MSAAEAPKRIGEPAVEPLISALKNISVRKVARETLVQIGEPVVDPLISALRDADTDVRRAAVEALGQIGEPRAVEPLRACLRDNEDFVRAAAVEALQAIEKQADPSAYMEIESVRWLCYADESTARTAFQILKGAALGGPGRVDLRYNPRVPYGWWVVLYNVVCHTSHDLVRVYGIPPCNDPDSWFPYEGRGKLNANTKNSQLVDTFEVDANVEGLLKAAQEMGNSSYLCRPYSMGGNIKCHDEAMKRLRELGWSPR